MNVVDAIDTWIDERIDDLTDDELESILDILDAVTASTLGDLDKNEIFREDIDDMVDLVTNDDDHALYVESILRSALYGDASEFDDDELGVDYLDEAHLGESFLDEDEDAPEFTDDDQVDEAPTAKRDDNDSADFEDDGGADDLFDEESDRDFDIDASDVDDLSHDDADDLTGDDPTHDDSADERGASFDSADVDDAHYDASDAYVADAGTGDADADESFNDSFFAELAGVSARDDFDGDRRRDDTTPAGAAAVELLEFDDLGPTFLTLEPVPPKAPAAPPWRRYAVASFIVLGLAAFVYGSFQLVGSLSEEEQPVASQADAESTAEPEEEPKATATSEPDDDPEDEDEDDTGEEDEDDDNNNGAATESAATPTPEPTPVASRIAVRLVNGDVVLLTPTSDDTPVDVDMLYEADDDEFAAATFVAWIENQVAIIDRNGDILIIDPSDRRPRPVRQYEAGGGLAKAVEVTSLFDQIAIRTIDGDISVIARDERANPDTIEFLWNAEDEGVRVGGLASIDDQLAFVLDDGQANLIKTGDDNEVVPIWADETQPPAFNLRAGGSGILLGVGQGAVARYETGDFDVTPLTPVWDPFSTEQTPAIGYSTAGDLTALVLSDGSIVLADDTGTGEKLWDPEETELRALALSGSDSEVVVLIETGSVLRIPLGGDAVQSLWDITDESLLPANQIVVELVPTE